MSLLGRRAQSASGPMQIGTSRTGVAAPGPVDTAWQALRDVYDPELCLDIVSLGLVYDIRREERSVVVEMTLTTPGCPVSDSLPEMARVAIADALGPDEVDGVDMRVVWDPPWTPAMMDDDAAGVLGYRAQ